MKNYQYFGKMITAVVKLIPPIMERMGFCIKRSDLSYSIESQNRQSFLDPLHVVLLIFVNMIWDNIIHST